MVCASIFCPDGCTDFVFTLGEVADTVEEESLIMQPYRSYFVGPMTKYSELITYSESVHMFGVRFLPCGLSCFTKFPLHEFVNDRISTREMKAVFDDTFVERLCEQEHIGDRIRIVEEYLLSYLSRHYESADSHIVVAVDIINQFGGKRPVRSLIDEVCLCQRHFERKFKLLYRIHSERIQPYCQIQECRRIVKEYNISQFIDYGSECGIL